MKQINEDRLENDLGYRYEYLSEFMEFGQADIDLIHSAAAALAPIVPQLVDAVYDKLFLYSSTKRHFVARQSGYSGVTPENLEALEVDHAMIRFRKEHLARYLTALVTRPYDGHMLNYLDRVGMIHTPSAGSKDLAVPLVQMNALLGFVADAFTATIAGLGLDRELEIRMIRAFQKLLWLQNDFISRHYTEMPQPTPA